MSSHHRRTPLLHVTSTPGVVGRSIPLPLPAHLVRPGTHRSASRDAPFLGLEPLEPRTLLAATIAINFQPSGAAVPPGYLVDSGAVFANRNNGYTYGWNALTTATRDRNSSRSPDQRYDTLNHMQQSGSRTWEIALPNGLYTVKLVAGDPSYTDSIYKINAESTLLINGTPSSTKRWFTNTATVSVTDGRLTLSNATGAKNNKINFIEITAAPGSAPALPAPQNLTTRSALNTARVDLSWTHTSTDVVAYRVERSTNGTTFTAIATLTGTTATTFGDINVKPATPYHYRVIAISSAAESAASATAAVTTSNFQVYDSLLFKNRPDLTSYGMDRIRVTGTGFWAGVYPNYDATRGDETATRALAREVDASGQILMIDIEHWPLDIRTASDAQVQESIDKIAQIVGWIRDEAPEVILGMYSFMPLRDYWTPYNYFMALQNSATSSWWAAKLPDFTSNYLKWQQANERLRPLAEKMDVMFPSLYTFYDDQAGWEIYAKANIEEARRYGKPVVPLLWMYYHDSNATLKGQTVPAGYWQKQLDTVRQHADSVVIWGGWTYDWNEQESWWQVTRDWLA